MRSLRAPILVGSAVALVAACGFEGSGALSADSAPDATADGGGEASAAADTSTDTNQESAVADADAEAGADGAISDARADAPDADASIVDAAEAGSTSALAFDGIDDFVPVLRQVQADFTLEAWVKTTTSRAGTNFYDGLGVIYADVSGSANDFGSSILNGKFAFGTVDLTIQSTTTVTTGIWVHVAAVRIQASGTMRVLVNGTQETQTTSGSTALLNAPSIVNLGGNTIDSRFFNGTIDEVRIWNVARTAAQIQGAMKTRLVGNEAGLVGYWRFDDGAGNVASDSSGSANNGTLGTGTPRRGRPGCRPARFDDAMSAAALTLLVLIASGDGGRDASGPVATSMARAVREALGADAQVIIRETPRVPSDDDAIALARELQASAVIELLWKDPEHRRATLHFHAEPGASRWTDREVGFDATDADAERGRMIGFALASMLPERASAMPAPAPASPPPPPPPLPSQRDPGERESEARSERPPEPPGEVLHWLGSVDLAAAGSVGGEATGLGVALSARWDFAAALSVRLAGGVRAGEVGAADASSTIWSGAVGVVWRALPATTTRSFGLALRADALAIQYRLSRATSHATLWLPGADVALEGSWMFARPLALFAAVGGELAFGAPEVFLFSNHVTTISPVRGVGEAGIRVHF